MICKRFYSSLFGLALCTTMLMPSNVLAEKFVVSRGTRTAFGGVTVNYGTPMMPAPLTTYSSANWSGALLLDFGYFVIDRFAILFNAAGYTGFTSTANAFVSVGLGAMYVFENQSPIYPYLQASVKGNWMPPAPTAPQVWSISVAPQVGFLAGINRHVAIDVAIQANIGFPLGQTGAASAAYIMSGIGLIGARISL